MSCLSYTKHIIRMLLVFTLVFLIVHSSTISHSQGVVAKEELWSRIKEIFSVIEEAGSEGMNVTDIINDLNTAIYLLRKGDKDSLERAKVILDKAYARAIEILRELPEYRMNKYLSLYLRIALILSIPIMVYFLLPRLYLELWYRFRKHWVITRK